MAYAEEIDPASTPQPEMAFVNQSALLSEIEFAGGDDEALRGAVRIEGMLDEVMGIGWLARPHRVALAEGIEAGRKALDEAMARYATFAPDEDWFATTTTLATAAVLVGGKEHAANLYAALLPHAERWVVIGNGGSCRGPVASFLAGLARVTGDGAAAAAHRAAATSMIETQNARGVAHWMELRPISKRPPSPRRSPLSAREAEVLALVARGHSNQEIAATLVLSVRTVQRHIENAYARLGVHNRAGATLAAVNLGLVAPADTRPGVG
jgi:ATP/maltotriose-dependent transcriptional regulator MalT